MNVLKASGRDPLPVKSKQCHDSFCTAQSVSVTGRDEAHEIVTIALESSTVI